MSNLSHAIRSKYPLAFWLGFFHHWVMVRVTSAFSWHVKHKKLTAVFVLSLVIAFGYAQNPVINGNYGEFPTIVDSSQVEPTTNTSKKYSFNAASLANQIGTKVDASLKDLSNNTSLKKWGDQISIFFLITLMIWGLLKNMAAGKGLGEWIGDLVPLMMAFGIVSLFLDKSAANLIVKTMNALGTAIGGGDWSTIQNAVTAAAVPMFKAMASIMDFPRVTSQSEWSLATLVTAVPSALVSLFGRLIAVFLMLLGTVSILATTIMSFISVELVLILAPVMVPFLMFQPMNWIFDAWLRFLLGACMMKVVGAFLLKMAIALLTSMQQFAMQIYTEAQGASSIDAFVTDLMLITIMLVFALLAVLLMLQAPTISAGLLQGSSAGVGFKGVGGVTQSAAGKMAFAAGKGTVSVASKGTNQAFGGVVGAVKGHRDARSLTSGSNRLSSNAGDGQKMTGLKAMAYKMAYNRAEKRSQGPLKPKGFVP
jgi:type IV secretion system protein TrbL